jgi:uncharacterized membrane protein AbrB (regulator of aidB expression)
VDRHTKNDLRELLRFLIPLAIVFVALLIMALILGYIGTKVPVPPLDNYLK